MPLCRLCQKDRVLCESHIVPKFLYEDLRNTKRQIMSVTGHGKRGWAAIQDGAKEHLLCECCEQHFNIHFETPFRTYWIESSPIPDPWVDENPRWIRPNYNSFKLFHLRVLFRASVTTLPMFSAVDLGIHEERIRLMLLNCDAGNYYEYPVGGYAVVHHRTREIIRLISQAQAFKVGGRRCYGMMYGGVEWWTCVASDRNTEFEHFALKDDGQMCLAVFPWQEVAAIQKASAALKRTDA